MTLTEKWDYFKSQIEARETEFVQIHCPNPPKELFEVSPNGHIRVLTIERVGYYPKKYFTRNQKRASTAQVLEIQYAYNNPEELDQSRIYLYWRSDNSSSAVKLTEIGKYIQSHEEAIVKSTQLKEKVKKEEDLLANGHIRCCYCKRVTPETTAISANIIGRDRKQVYDTWKKRFVSKACVTQTLMKFCSNTCAANEQMSREG